MKIDLRHGDCLEIMKGIPDKSVGLVLTDPPYNIGKADWDKISNYVDWCEEWLKECTRILRDSGTLIFWHNDMPQIARLLDRIQDSLPLVYNSFGIWHKYNHHTNAWKNRSGGCSLRSWFNITEMFFVFVKPAADRSDKQWDRTGLDYIYSQPECFKPLKDWYKSELERLGIGKPEIYAKYTEVTGKKPYMPDRHYFKDSQFEIPTAEVYNSVYRPLGFNKSYEELRQSYEELRPVFNIYPEYQYSNIFTADKGNFSDKSPHPCAKPVNILSKLIRTHSRPGDIVLDCFMGGGSMGVACAETGRDFIGIELEKKYFDIAQERINAACAELGGQYGDHI